MINMDIMPRDATSIKHAFNDLRYELTKRLALLLILASGIAMWWTILPPKPFEEGEFAVWTGLFGLGFLVIRYGDTHQQLIRYLFVGVLTSAVVMAMIFSNDLWLPFAGIVMIFIASTLVNGGGVISGMLIGTTAFYLIEAGTRDYPQIGLLSAIALSIAVSWLIAKTLYATLEWYEATQSHTAELLRETRNRRAELKQVVKSLGSAYDTQTRMQRELIYARQKAEEMQHMKERFAANISHELRTPLNIIWGFSEIMHLSPEVYGEIVWTPTLRRDVYQIYRNSQHLLKMIDDILDLSRFEMTEFTLQREPTPLNPLLESAIEIAQTLFQNHPVELSWDIHPNLPTLNIDRSRIRQVLLNLFTNARRFVPSGSVKLVAMCEGDNVVISMCDTGIGISADKLSLIFDDFYQVDTSLSRSYGGAGLGLAISKRFVEAHQGRIWAESEDEQGTTFTFTLPISPNGILDDIEIPQTKSVIKNHVDTHNNINRVLVIGADFPLITTLKRHLSSFELISISAKDSVSDAILEYFPMAIIHNIPPGQHQAVEKITTTSVPVIQCSLPSTEWINHEVNIKASLSKPITMQQIQQAVSALDDIENILIVDDDRGFVQLVERMLTENSTTYHIQRAYDGENALVTLQDTQPDLIILDVIMPNMGGMQLLEQLSQSSVWCEIPIILLSATDYTEHILANQDSELVIYRTNGLHADDILTYLSATITAIHA